ncbi:MAG TPA: hypothetical protein VFV34_01410 [Blastocatellia bacterium]|nr:hypothetical protein [Blastocatellia bacterium]
MFRSIITVTRRLRCAWSITSVRTTAKSGTATSVPEVIKTGSTLIIQTLHSTYTFSVTDEVAKRGLLSGGVFAPSGVEARLLNADFSKLRVGSQAMFLIETNRGVKRVTTSRITQLVHEICGSSVSTDPDSSSS